MSWRGRRNCQTPRAAAAQVPHGALALKLRCRMCLAPTRLDRRQALPPSAIRPVAVANVLARKEQLPDTSGSGGASPHGALALNFRCRRCLAPPRIAPERPPSRNDVDRDRGGAWRRPAGVRRQALPPPRSELSQSPMPWAEGAIARHLGQRLLLQSTRSPIVWPPAIAVRAHHARDLAVEALAWTRSGSGTNLACRASESPCR